MVGVPLSKINSIVSGLLAQQDSEAPIEEPIEEPIESPEDDEDLQD
jgi:hypothetical protein